MDRSLTASSGSLRPSPCNHLRTRTIIFFPTTQSGLDSNGFSQGRVHPWASVDHFATLPMEKRLAVTILAFLHSCTRELKPFEACLGLCLTS